MASDFIKKIIVVSGIVLLGGAGLVLAFTGPLQSPSGGNPQFWLLNENEASLYYSSGGVGINTSAPNPSYKLDVEGGDIYASGAIRGETGLCIGSNCRTSLSQTPSDMVLFFDLSSCPTGWSEFTSARGRYIVGLPSGGTLNGTAGTALSDQENRPVGQHTHTVNSSQHRHTVYAVNSIGLAGTDYGQGASSTQAVHYNETAGNAYTGITLANSGTVAGTNAPYIQLLVCQKD